MKSIKWYITRSNEQGINSQTNFQITIQWIKIEDKSTKVLWIWFEIRYLQLSKWIYKDLQKDNSKKDDQGGGGIGGIPTHYLKNWLVPSHVPSLFWPKNADFVFFMQFLAILPKLSPPTCQWDPHDCARAGRHAGKWICQSNLLGRHFNKSY